MDLLLYFDEHGLPFFYCSTAKLMEKTTTIRAAASSPGLWTIYSVDWRLQPLRQMATTILSACPFSKSVAQLMARLMQERTHSIFVFAPSQIYLESLQDLLASSTSSASDAVPKLLEDGKGATTVANIREIPVTSADEVLHFLLAGYLIIS